MTLLSFAWLFSCRADRDFAKKVARDMRALGGFTPGKGLTGLLEGDSRDSREDERDDHYRKR